MQLQANARLVTVRRRDGPASDMLHSLLTSIWYGSCALYCPVCTRSTCVSSSRHTVTLQGLNNDLM